MDVFQGSSGVADGAEAVRAATANFPPDLDLILVFHSTQQGSDAVAAELAARFPKVPHAGCSTSGEHLDGQHLRGSLVACGIRDRGVRWSVQAAESLADLDAEATANALLGGLGLDKDQLDPKRHFCLALLEGLGRKEEVVTARMAEALVGIPMVGGSAGDDLQFKNTTVLANGRTYDRGGVFVLGESADGFEILKHQHFVRTERTLVVTRVDEAARRVYELDGIPAAQAYARAMGLRREELSDAICFQNPLIFECNGQSYVRSIQKIEADDSLSFYCALEDGMVLTIGGHLEIDQALAEAQPPRGQKAELLFVSNCILRALEATGADKHGPLGCSFLGLAHHVIGFDTYGEQLNGLHINQTVVGLALGRVA